MGNCSDCQTWTQAAEMVAHDVAFYSHDPKTDAVTFCLLMNDTFSYASADAEPVPWAHIPDVHALWKAGGWQALVNWVARRRGVEPLPDRKG